MEPEVSRWKQVWKRIGIITVFSLLSIALFGLLYWFVCQTSLKYSWHSWTPYVHFVWAAITVFLLRRNFLTILNYGLGRNYRFFAQILFFVGIVIGLFGAEDYIHRATSSYLHCNSITRESIGTAEYIMSEQGINVMDNCRGYDVEADYNSKGFSVHYNADVVAPIIDSRGVYVASYVSGGTYKTGWKSGDEMEDDYHDARAKLREIIPNQKYDVECRTYRRIFPYNSNEYTRFVNAVEYSSQFLNDSDFMVENLPPIIKPIYDVKLGSSARPNIFAVIGYLTILFFIIVALLMSVEKD